MNALRFSGRRRPQHAGHVDDLDRPFNDVSLAQGQALRKAPSSILMQTFPYDFADLFQA
jgi:hypothetical protein